MFKRDAGRKSLETVPLKEGTYITNLKNKNGRRISLLTVISFCGNLLEQNKSFKMHYKQNVHCVNTMFTGDCQKSLLYRYMKCLKLGLSCDLPKFKLLCYERHENKPNKNICKV